MLMRLHRHFFIIKIEVIFMAKKKSSSTKKNSSSNVSAKKIFKASKKLAKKNPALFAFAVFGIVLLAGAAIGGYFAYRYFVPEVRFEINGAEETKVGLGATYNDKGVVATYNGKNVADKVVTTFYDGLTELETIPTAVEKTYTVKYDLDYGKYSGQLTRMVNVTDFEGIDINFLQLGNKYTGDSTFIKAGDTDILIDAGSRANSATTISKFIDKYCDDGVLEYVIATHAHQDHIAGFVGSSSATGIFKKYKIDTLIDFSLTNSTTKLYKNYVSLRDSKIASGDIAHHYTANECIQGENGAQKTYEVAAGIQMEILDQKYYREETSNENNYSVCALFTHAENNYLFTGDLEEDGEASLVELNNLPEVTLFKGAHHGSYTANSLDLLNVIRPKNICICCCAGSDEYTKVKTNMFPAQVTINRMAVFTDKIYVTSVISDDGKSVLPMNGDINCHSTKGTNLIITGSENSIILKDTDWFKKNRTWPNYA